MFNTVELIIEGVALNVTYDFTPAEEMTWECGAMQETTDIESVKAGSVEIINLICQDDIEEMELKVSVYENDLKELVA